MTKRQLLYLLSEEKYLTAISLSQKLQKSTRTIQNMMRNLNEELKGVVHIYSKPGSGYKLEIQDNNRFMQFLVQQNQNDEIVRRQNIIIKSFLVNEYVKISVLADMCYVNQRTISTDIKLLKKELKEFDLQINSRPHYGLHLVGEEVGLRKFLLYKKWEEKYYFNKEEESSINRYLHSYEISTVSVQNIKDLIAISISRNYKLRQLDEIYLPDKELVDLNYKFQWQLSSLDLVFITNYIYHCKKNSGESRFIVQVLDGLRILEETFGLDFLEDSHLTTKITNHLTALKIRLDNRVMVKNPLLSDIQKNLTLEYNMARFFATWLFDPLQLSLTEDELGFLAITFALITSRLEKMKKNVLILSDIGSSSHQYLELTYQHLFGKFVEKMTICHPYDIDKLNLQGYDYIFTTGSFDFSTQVDEDKIRFVPYFLKPNDEQLIRNILEAEEELSFSQLLNQKLFFRITDRLTPEEVIIKICSNIQELTGDTITEKVLNRYQMGSTQLGNHVAFLHPAGRKESSSVGNHYLAVTVLSSPIKWDFSEIQLIIIASLPSISKSNMLIYDSLSTLFLEDSLLEKFLENADFKTFESLLLKIERSKRNG
ncbi:BglG family transcription antiterminator [Streptococcus marmotae]|uniref:BglG family transcription antiterminator n=1 Tax=Streptococcus marmotae TaxID=1825069 RepID=UPI00082E696F|nr:HTH domain-containing protein [Streptococcus marmotae]